MRKQSHKFISLFIAVILLLVVAVPASAAVTTSWIDFEGLAEGAFVSSLAYGSGVSGDPVAGSVQVYGHNPNFPGMNAAMVFDAACPGGCSGGDDDLYGPAQGKVLIVTEDFDPADPDDADVRNQYIQFDFAGFAEGFVTVESLVLGDVESVETGGKVDLYDGSLLVKSVAIPVNGDGVYFTLPINASGVNRMRVVFKGSGAVDNVKVLSEEEPPDGNKGCTPGYWKQEQHFDSWAPTGYSPGQTLESVFDVPNGYGLDNFTLLQALKFQGGSGTTAAARILLRASVAAVLNASHPDVPYPLGAAQVIADVNAALATHNRPAMLGLKGELDMYNNLGCPIH